jgi:mRNA interferase HigB
MRIVARSTLMAFGRSHADAKTPLEDWFRVCRKAAWTGPADAKTAFGTRVDILPRNRAVFDLGGNKYRLVTVILYRSGIMYVRFIGTHAEYDKINAATI